LATALAVAGLASTAGAGTAAAAGPNTLDLKVLLIGSATAGDPVTAAWKAALASEGVPYTEVDATGAYGAETVTLPALSSGSTGFFNGVVTADSPAAFASGALTNLDAYESSFGVRQIDGYMYPDPALGATDATAGDVSGTTGTLSAAGLTAFPELAGPIPLDTGTYGYGATVVSGAPYTSILNNSAGDTLAGIYQHPGTDPQAGVAELSLFFDYNSTQLQWLLLAPGLINWVTQDTHLGLYRNYFGQDIDDNFLADNQWSSQYQCTPAATDPPDYTCPLAQQGVDPGTNGAPPDAQMSATDVAYVVAWEQQTGIRLNLLFNGIGACTADTVADESGANCTGTYADPNGTTWTDPGQVAQSGDPNDAGLVNALLADKADFNWEIHTWSHLFLGCTVWAPQVLTSATADASGGTFTAGSYSYEITAATAYGESEPSTPQSVTVAANGSVTLNWPEATNGTGTGGNAGPTLAQEEASHTGGTGFWGYNIYRENPGATTYGLVGQVAENTAATSSTTYTFTDTGTTPGEAPNSGPDFPTATNPGIDCAPTPAGGTSSWLPAASATANADTSIDAEIGLDQAFAAANALPNYTPSAVVTGEHSGIESPNMAGALADTGITTVGADASRQPQQYTIGSALTAPRYPSNIYYNAANWPDELNEYNTLYVQQGVSLGNATYPNDVGHCTGTSSTTCLAAPATEATVLASESHIMLSHVLANDPRVGYAHQTDLIGPATQSGADYGYTILTLINNMLSQYNTWYNTNSPLDQMTNVTEAQVLQEQGAWATASAGAAYSASETNGTVTVTNTGPQVSIPVTVPAGTTVNGSTTTLTSYGGEASAWFPLGTGSTVTLGEAVAPTITSANSATSIVGAAFSFTVTTTGSPAPALTESGALPSGITFTDNGNGTATIAGTSTTGSGGSYPITITATNATAPAATQSFTLANDEASSITSATTATFTTGVAGTYTVTTTGYPAPTVTESGTLPSGLSFTAATATTSATISGTPAAGTAGTYPVTLSATNASGSTATLALTITVNAAAAPVITSASTADFTLNQAGAVAITTTGAPTPKITETGGLPAGLTLVDNGNGTALLSGTPTATGTTSITITASNGISPDATQPFTIVVGQAPAFTSGTSTTFTAGTAGSFPVTTSGYPAPSFGWGNVPPGMTFTDNGNGTATLAGTPTTPGTYAMALSAVNAYGTAQQTLTVTVAQAPTITSANSATFTVGAAGSFPVTTTGAPTAAITESGALPSGVTFVDNGNGTATLAGTPGTGTNGSYPITITAANGGSPNAVQSFTLTVNAAPTAPTITSANATTFTVGTASSFPVMTTGSPTAAITESGALPSGVTLVDNGNGTATLSGTPASGSQGSYPFTITAANTVLPNAVQSFTLTVNPATAAPVITSATGTTFAAGTAGTFSVTTTGYPTATLSDTSSPALPSGVTFKDNGNGTATLSGTPPAGSQGTYTLTITATSTAGTAVQSFVLTVNSGLAITSANTATATAGSAFSFTVTTTGTPTPTLTHTGTLPAGITFTANTNGTATLSGTPAATAHGTYPITFTARNSTGTASQAFTLTVAETPTFSSATTATETAGTAFTFTVNTTAYPTATLSAGTLPSGLSFSDNGNGTGTLSGTTAVAAGTDPITFTAKNTGGTTTQSFTLTVKAAGTTVPVPTFTSAATDTVTSGAAFTFTVTTVGSPTTTYTTRVTHSGTLPAGVSFSNNGDGTATLTGTPTAASAGVYPITFTATNSAGTVTQSFVLTVTGKPAISSAASATATVGSSFNFTVKATGGPTPTMAESGALPQGLTWTDNGNGTATLAGTPGVGQGGVYHLTFTATNTGGTASQAFTLTVDQAPAITSAAAATATHGTAFTFTFTSTGYPVPNVTHTGTVRGLTYTNNGNGTATLRGTPTTAGTYTLTITARDSVGTATQTFTLTVS
jgi:Putative Ig domain